MKLWIDDVRPAPEGYVWCKSVVDAIGCIGLFEKSVACYQWEIDTANYPQLHCGLKPIPENIQKEIDKMTIELIDIDHDAGDYASDGGDYIKLLDWLEETGRNYPIRIHSMNVVGRQNMEAICRRNGWKIVY